MGITYVTATVSGSKGKHARVRMLVDSGAGYSLLPQRVWKRLGLRPKRKKGFELADGRVIERQVSDCRFKLGKEDAPSPVILGEPGDDEALLGVVTLESLGLVLDPFARRLIPMRLLLYRAFR